MHKFEMIEQSADLLQAQEKSAAEVLITEEEPNNSSSNSPFQVKVTMLSQVDLGEDTIN